MTPHFFPAVTTLLRQQTARRDVTQLGCHKRNSKTEKSFCATIFWSVCFFTGCRKQMKRDANRGGFFYFCFSSSKKPFFIFNKNSIKDKCFFVVVGYL